MQRQRHPELSLGVLLLAHQFYNEWRNTIPPVTLLTVTGQSLLFMGVISPPWKSHEVCLSGESILYYSDYRRLILSAIEHVNDIHLYHNMVSFVLKGRTLEKRYGSLKFAILLLVLTVATSVINVGLALVATNIFETDSYMQECAIGFSGVIFALKVLTTHHEGHLNHLQDVYGFWVPTKYVVWAELVIIHVLVPSSSFIGHLAGILVGVAFVKSPLKHIFDAAN